jgi:hypothetical protein
LIGTALRAPFYGSKTPGIESGAVAEGASSQVRQSIEKISQLFHSLDPFPFRERDLDKGR